MFNAHTRETARVDDQAKRARRPPADYSARARTMGIRSKVVDPVQGRVRQHWRKILEPGRKAQQTAPLERRIPSDDRSMGR